MNFEEWKEKQKIEYDDDYSTEFIISINGNGMTDEEILRYGFERGKEQTEEELHKYKLALFSIIRNNVVMPSGIKLGKTRREINRMSIETEEEIIKSIDFEKMEHEYKNGEKK